MLRRSAGNRPPQHSEKRKAGRLSVQTRALSAAWSFGFEIGQDCSRIAASEAANGEWRFRRNFAFRACRVLLSKEGPLYFGRCGRN